MRSTTSYTHKQIVAAVSFADNEGSLYLLDPQDEEFIAEFLGNNEMDYEEDTGVPAYMEASSWCVNAPIGDIYESDRFMIVITDRDEIR